MKIKTIAFLIFVVTSISWGCNQSGSGDKESSTNIQDQKKEQVQAPVQKTQASQQAGTSGEADQFGRKPGEAHYGHSHASDQPHTNTAPQKAQQGTPTDGGPDKFGRNPGDAHYGHNHE